MFDDSGLPAGALSPAEAIAVTTIGHAATVSCAPGHRASLEAFIAARYATAFDARVEHFCRHLVGLPQGERAGWRAGVGYTAAADGPLYLEHYLDAPIEEALAQATGVRVMRSEVAEVGNLAATSPGAAREIIVTMREHLERAGFAWVAFTATRELRNSFARLRLALVDIGPAHAHRLADGGEAWGRYYAHDPRVVAGSLRTQAGAPATRTAGAPASAPLLASDARRRAH